MRSLWRRIALRWLGGRGSEALAADSALTDLLMMGERELGAPAFQVKRQSGVSHHAMMSPQEQNPAAQEPVPNEASRGDRSG
jgi:hypothetical protein